MNQYASLGKKAVWTGHHLKTTSLYQHYTPRLSAGYLVPVPLSRHWIKMFKEISGKTPYATCTKCLTWVWGLEKEPHPEMVLLLPTGGAFPGKQSLERGTMSII